jgi:probable HAF family extracellular repeat protein
MKRIWLSAPGLCALVVLLTIACPLQASPPRYICLDLSTPPDYVATFANSLNHTGQVVGLAGFYANPLLVHRAFLKNYRQAMLDLGTLGGNAAEAFCINNTGQVVGFAYDAVGEFGRMRAFLKDPGQPMVDLGTLGGQESWAYGINQAGQVVGHADDVAGKRHAFQKNPGEPDLIDLGVLGPNLSSEAYAINNFGQVVGSAAYGLGSGQVHAFLTKAGQSMEDLGTLAPGGAGRSDAHGINDAGQVVGEADDAAGVRRPFLKNLSEPLQDLDPTKHYHHGVAYGINQGGQIVGSVGLASDYSVDHAFLWDRGVLYDLNDLVVSLPPGQILYEATAINEQAWILASGSGAYWTTYLLVPRSSRVPLNLLLQD